MNRTLVGHGLLVASLQAAPVIDRGGYDYLVHPLTDGLPRADPALLREAVAGLARQVEEALAARGGEADVLLTAEAMGLPLVAGLATRLDVPYLIARKRSYGLEGEIHLAQETGYSHATLHLNDVHPGDRVVVIDDLISTGGTLRALARGVAEAGAGLLHIAAVVTKQADLGPIGAELGCGVSALAAVEIVRAGDGKQVRVTATDVRS